MVKSPYQGVRPSTAPTSAASGNRVFSAQATGVPATLPQVNINTGASGLQHVMEARRAGSREFIVGAGGEFNAGSKAELLRTHVEIMEGIANKRMSMESARQVKQASAQIHAQMQEAYQDRVSGRWLTMGAAMATEISNYAEREAFMRKFMVEFPVNMGEKAEIRPKIKTMVAQVSTAPTEIRPVNVEDHSLTLPEFNITAGVRISRNDAFRRGPGLLEEKLLEAQEAIPVEEDRVMLRHFRAACAGRVELIDSLSSTNLTALQDTIDGYGFSVATMLMASNVMKDIISNASDFGDRLNPVSHLEMLQTGFLATLFGMEIVTDAYREPTLKVLNRGEIFLMVAPQNMGGYISRGPVEVTEIDGMQQRNIPERGYNLIETIGMCVFNPKGIVQAIRRND